MNLICHIEEALSLNQSTLQLYVGIFKVCSLKLWPKISLTRPFTQKQNNNRKLARIAGGASFSFHPGLLAGDVLVTFFFSIANRDFRDSKNILSYQHIPPPQWPGFCAQLCTFLLCTLHVHRVMICFTFLCVSLCSTRQKIPFLLSTCKPIKVSKQVYLTCATPSHQENLYVT